MNRLILPLSISIERSVLSPKGVAALSLIINKGNGEKAARERGAVVGQLGKLRAD
jgi:hypothetical protein